MENLLKNYIKSEFAYSDFVEIKSHDIDGANCHVKFYTDDEYNYLETVTVNIWDVVAFLNHQTKNK